MSISTSQADIRSGKIRTLLQALGYNTRELTEEERALVNPLKTGFDGLERIQTLKEEFSAALLTLETLPDNGPERPEFTRNAYAV